MKSIKPYWWLVWCAAAWAVVFVVKLFPAQIEAWYSRGIYLWVSQAQRWLLGWLPFSVGDVIYACLCLWGFYKVFRIIWRMWQRTATKPVWLKNLKFSIQLLTGAYLWFHLAWGFNYHRLGSSHQLQLLPNAYTLADVDTLTITLNQRLRLLCADTASLAPLQQWSQTQMLQQGLLGYSRAAQTYPFLSYGVASVKPTLMGKAINYFGVLGYANPFTGEAQMNYTMPRFLWPYTLCHEMAHQLGYATEAEANLIGYLACKANGSKPFAYSVYAGLQGYALGDLYATDSILAAQRHAETPSFLTADRKKSSRFFKQFQNPFEPLIYGFYENYLKANNQPLGHKSYNFVVAWLIAYAKKYGWESL
ncbi:MAG: DUF3810 domain-containing protein [Bacteroidetes bacterium]|nr:MAG: DUF3810 domain-containing protein [Bacteroidota bacterium]